MFLFSILGELTFLGALVLEFYAFLSPVPWFPRDLGASLINFTPYVPPQGYTPSNPCSSPSLSNVSIGAVNVTHAARAIPADGPLLRFRRSPSGLSFEVPKIRRDATTGNNSIAIWVGALGTCTRDADGSMHCTQSSYNNPQYNLSYLQPNSVFYAAMMPGLNVKPSLASLVSISLASSSIFWDPTPSGAQRLYRGQVGAPRTAARPDQSSHSPSSCFPASLNSSSTLPCTPVASTPITQSTISTSPLHADPNANSSQVSFFARPPEILTCICG
ncbi:hypothetical protein BS47DRAFT_1173276 [Hydnum rufescens UP504]|uniref:Uncharacterized protein n=1 Tax=Hydnum rufescens UP504 TaxID=1448309 RepID=A0A9P6ATH9_9AGAM|nr:hypothetical protein BS47DRAFT_1173276 [Hydnum rufescens UP504]